MQKISSYLYPNRIKVLADLTASTLEWKIVYQRVIKIYKGLDNYVEVEVMNADQKKLDITGLTLKFLLVDEQGTQIIEKNVDVATGIKGIGRILIEAADVEGFTSQYLRYVVVREQTVGPDTIRTPLYGDTQFGAKGTVHLLDGMPTALPTKTIDTFITIHDDSQPQPWPRRLYSEAVQIMHHQGNANGNGMSMVFTVDTLDADIEVQVSTDDVISSESDWETIETFTVANTSTSVSKTYLPTAYNAEAVWLRIKYSPTPETTGKIDKVVIAL